MAPLTTAFIKAILFFAVGSVIVESRRFYSSHGNVPKKTSSVLKRVPFLFQPTVICSCDYLKYKQLMSRRLLRRSHVFKVENKNMEKHHDAIYSHLCCSNDLSNPRKLYRYPMKIRLSKKVFVPAYNDVNDLQYQTLANELINAVEQLLAGVKSTLASVEVEKFSIGSVVAHLVLTTKGLFTQEMYDLLKRTIESGKLGNLNVDLVDSPSKIRVISKISQPSMSPETTEIPDVSETSQPGMIPETTEIPDVSTNPSSASGDDYENECLCAHNQKRTAHGVPTLTWSTQITSSAQKFANKLAATDTGDLYHEPSTYGENIYTEFGDILINKRGSCSKAVDSWYNETRLYDFNNPGYSENIGHFTQVVWKTTIQVGVAEALSKTNKRFVVARYSPPGNILDHFQENVPPPLSGSPASPSIECTAGEKPSNTVDQTNPTVTPNPNQLQSTPSTNTDTLTGPTSSPSSSTPSSNTDTLTGPTSSPSSSTPTTTPIGSSSPGTNQPSSNETTTPQLSPADLSEPSDINANTPYDPNTPGKLFQVVLGVLGHTFTPELSNPSSEEFQKLKTSIEKAIKAIYDGIEAFRSATLIQLKPKIPGKTPKNEVEAEVNLEFKVNAPNHLALLIEQVKSGSLGELKVHPELNAAIIRQHFCPMICGEATSCQSSCPITCCAPYVSVCQQPSCPTACAPGCSLACCLVGKKRRRNH